MKHYVDITLLPDADIALYFLWEKVYQQIHLALVETKSADNTCNVGSCFPHYQLEKKHLGNKLRLFATSETSLVDLNLPKWLSRLTDYTHATSIRPVPNKVTEYAFFRRLSDKSNLERLARRRAKRLDISYETSLDYFKNDPTRKHSTTDIHQYPFIQSTSLSSGIKFPLTIALEKTDALVFEKGFSTYGLSSQCSVPLF